MVCRFSHENHYFACTGEATPLDQLGGLSRKAPESGAYNPPPTSMQQPPSYIYEPPAPTYTVQPAAAPRTQVSGDTILILAVFHTSWHASYYFMMLFLLNRGNQLRPPGNLTPTHWVTTSTSSPSFCVLLSQSSAILALYFAAFLHSSMPQRYNCMYHLAMWFKHKVSRWFTFFLPLSNLR